jgi:DNA-binding XRE family transcriptional regulator
MKTSNNPYCDLKTIRKKRGFTQAKLATELGVKPASIAMIENNRRGMSIGLVIQVMDILDCGFRDIYPNGQMVKAPGAEIGPTLMQLDIVKDVQTLMGGR